MDKKDKDLEFLRGMEKLKASDIKAPDYKSDLDNEVTRVVGSAPTPESVTKIKNATQKIDTKGIAPIISGGDFMDKIASLRAAKAMGKKALGILPLAGTAYGLMSGNPAMAAEEAAGDIPIMGQAYEAIKPSESGNPEEEREMLAERQGAVDYRKSQASADARRAALMKLK
jgi:hypothetical protein